MAPRCETQETDLAADAAFAFLEAPRTTHVEQALSCTRELRLKIDLPPTTALLSSDSLLEKGKGSYLVQ